MANKSKARLARTRFMFERWDMFRALLAVELSSFIRASSEAGYIPAVRLNGTSDIVWERKYPDLFAQFPVQFYDYTKIGQRFAPSWNLPANYHLTFSRAESNHVEAARVLANGGNVAVVVRGCGIAAHPRPLPESMLGAPVLDGDLHDLRFLDGQRPGGQVIGLRAKGKARHDASGFVVDALSV
jgi:hypothetical protein